MARLLDEGYIDPFNLCGVSFNAYLLSDLICTLDTPDQGSPKLQEHICVNTNEMFGKREYGLICENQVKNCLVVW